MPAPATEAPVVPPGAPAGEVQEVPLSDIDLEDRTHEYRLDPRIEELKKSIQAEGQQIPIVLRRKGPPYQVVCGHRRVRALLALGGSTVKAIIRPELSDAEAFKLSFLENEERQNLNDLDRANLVGKLQEQGKTQEEIGAILDRSARQVRRYAEILSFPEAVRKAIAEEKISTGHGLVLNAALKKGHKLDVKALIEEIHQDNLSVPALRKRLRSLARDRSKRRSERLFQKRGQGFSMQAFTYNPKTADEKDRARMIQALEKALQVLESARS